MMKKFALLSLLAVSTQVLAATPVSSAKIEKETEALRACIASNDKLHADHLAKLPKGALPDAVAEALRIERDTEKLSPENKALYNAVKATAGLCGKAHKGSVEIMGELQAAQKSGATVSEADVKNFLDAMMKVNELFDAHGKNDAIIHEVHRASH